MRVWHIVRSRLRSIVFRDRREEELSEELQLHLEHEIERRVARASPGRRHVSRRFGCSAMSNR